MKRLSRSSERRMRGICGIAYMLRGKFSFTVYRRTLGKISLRHLSTPYEVIIYVPKTSILCLSTPYVMPPCPIHHYIYIWTWWLIGRFVAFHPKGCGFKSLSSRHAGTLGKSYTRSCLWCFGVKLRHSICAVSGAPLSSSGPEEALQK